METFKYIKARSRWSWTCNQEKVFASHTTLLNSLLAWISENNDWQWIKIMFIRLLLAYLKHCFIFGVYIAPNETESEDFCRKIM